MHKPSRGVLASALLLPLCAHAQSVTVFGVIDAFFAVYRTGGTSTRLLNSSGLTASRLGFRGTEDLGNGLKANFWLENGFNVDSGTQADATRGFNRQAWVSLSSAAGELRLGRQNSPQFTMEGQFDAFWGASMASGWNNLVSYVPRFDNTIGYLSPALGPVQVSVLGSLSEAHTGRPFANLVGAVEYRAGPLYLGVNHAQTQNSTTLVVTKTTFAGGSYAFGDAKVFAGYYRGSADNGSLRRTTFSLSGHYGITPTTRLAAGYARGNDRTTANNDGAQLSLGFFHDLSKRTMFYGSLSRMRNDNAATFSLNNATALGVVPQPGDDVRGLQLGIRHTF
jgi:predicted porin